VSIVTEPRQGPFRIGQVVQFLCLIEPTPPDPVIYQWSYVEEIFSSGSSTQQNISRTFGEEYLRYCWYFCEVSINKSLSIGSDSKLIELYGKYARELFLCYQN